MAFKMKRPIIKGTPLHQESIVAQTRTQADPSLATAASELGRSRVGKSIDYTIDPGKIKFLDKKKKKKDKEKKKKKEEILEIDTTGVKTLPTSKKKEKLKKATGTVETKESTDKFFEAAKKAGIDINTPEDYAKAERMLVYDEKLDNWRE